MSLDLPTTAELRANIVSGIEASIGQTVPLLPKSFIRVLSTVLAAVLVVLYKYAGSISNNTFVVTASASTTTVNGKTVRPLVEWGRLIGVGDPNAATAAVLTIDIAVTTAGGSLPVGTQFQHVDSGVVYLSTTTVAIVSPTTTVNVEAVSDPSGGSGLGSIGNRQIGDVLAFVSPQPGINSNPVVTTVVVTAIDAETTTAYRQRVIDRFQKRPQGGAYADYEQWAEEAAGILNAYPYTSVNPGEVDVYVESSTEVDGIPTAGQIQAAADSIELDDAGLASRRPANAFVNVLPITRKVFDVEVVNLIADDEVTVKAEIESALTDYFTGRAPFIEGLSIPPRKDQITLAGVSGVVEDIATASGALFTSINLESALVAIDIYVLGEGEKAKLGTVTYS